MAKRVTFGRSAPAPGRDTDFNFGANRTPRKPKAGVKKPAKGRSKGGPAGGGS